jgi:hypothetical protein
MFQPQCQLCLISPERPADGFAAGLAAALAAGGRVAAFQLRLKGADDSVWKGGCACRNRAIP